MSDMKNYTVKVTLEVQADSEQDAQDIVASALRDREIYAQGGIAPVGWVKATEGAPRLLDKVVG
jgi:hypothetical protein